MRSIFSCALIFVLFTSFHELFSQSQLYIIPSLNQTRPIEFNKKQTQAFLSNIHTGIQLSYVSKHLDIQRYSGSIEVGFRFNKYEYLTLLDRWDHGLQGVRFESSFQQIVMKRSTFMFSYGLSRLFKNFLRLELGTGLSYTLPGNPAAVRTALSIYGDPAFGTPQISSDYTSRLQDHLNVLIRFSAIVGRPVDRIGVGLGLTYNLIPEKPVSGEFTLSNNSGSSYLKSTFSPRLLTINFGLYINLYRTKE